MEEDHYHRLRHQEKMREMQFSMRRKSAEPRRKKICGPTCIMRSHVSFKVTGGQKGGLTMFA